ncbi:MAG TPA: Hsp20 family protein [Verrucomicrobiae bacterium]|nr:Hsp20 family protein [Verrucomicrobiae bacterium]
MDFVVRSRPGCFEPNADVFVDEERGQVVVTVELAGADPESIAVALDGRQLAVAGRRLERARRRGSFAQKEIAYGDFAKRVRLPAAVEHAEAAARFHDGLLTVVLPLAGAAYLQTAHTELRIMVKRTHS